MTLRRLIRPLTVLAAALALGACASVPSGPSMLVLPGTGKSFDQFRFDDQGCRQYAFQQIGGVSAAQTAENAAVRNAAVGTVIGAVAGAAIGGSRGAGVGAGTGLVVGSASGSDVAYASGYGAQRRYDHAYVQCMYANGHRVPVSGSLGGARGYYGSPAYASPPASASSSASIPPPPPGAPPPPPPGVGR